MTLDFAFTPGTIMGKVTDSGLPIAGAIVRALADDPAQQTSGWTQTDQEGNYTVQVQPGRYLLDASYEGNMRSYKVDLGQGDIIQIDFTFGAINKNTPHIINDVLGMATSLPSEYKYRLTAFFEGNYYSNLPRFELGSLDYKEGFIDNNFNWFSLYNLITHTRDYSDIADMENNGILKIATTAAPAQTVTLETNNGEVHVYLPDTTSLINGAAFFVAGDGSTYWADENHDGYAVDDAILDEKQAFATWHLARSASDNLNPPYHPPLAETSDQKEFTAYQVTSTAFTFHSDGMDRPLRKADGSCIKPEEIIDFFGTEKGFRILVGETEIYSDTYFGPTGMDEPLKVIYQDLSDEYGWPDMRVKPGTVAVDPVLGRFKFSDGNESPVEYRGRTHMHWGSPVFCSKKGNFVYIVNGESDASLTIIDVSDPLRPQLADMVNSGWSYYAYLFDDIAYVTGRGGVIISYDISDPYNVIPMAEIQFSNLERTSSIYKRENLLYVTQNDIPQINVVDVTCPSNPVLIKECPLSSPDKNGIIILIDDLAVVLSGKIMRIYNMLHLENINLISETTILSEDVSVVNALAKEKTLYLVAEGAGLSVWDISNPSQPIETYLYLTYPEVSGLYGYFKKDKDFGLEITENKLYVTGQYGSSEERDVTNDGYIKEFDISNPQCPELLHIYHEEKGFTDFRDIKIEGMLGYLVDRFYGLRIVNLDNKDEMEFIGGYRTAGEATDVHIFENTALVAQNLGGGVYLVDISDEINPQKVGYYHTGFNVYTIEGVANKVMYVGGPGFNTYYMINSPINAVDIANPTNPFKVKEIPTAKIHQETAIFENILFGSQCTLDISDIWNPVLLDNKSVIGAEQVYKIGNYVFRSSGRQPVSRYQTRDGSEYYAFTVYDVSIPCYPALISQVAIPIDNGGFITNVLVRENKAYFSAGWGNGIAAVNIANPRLPVYEGMIL